MYEELALYAKKSVTVRRKEHFLLQGPIHIALVAMNSTRKTQILKFVMAKSIGVAENAIGKTKGTVSVGIRTFQKDEQRWEREEENLS